MKQMIVLTLIVFLSIPIALSDTPQIDFVDPTPANDSTQANTDIFVNISSSDINDHYTFVEFNNSLTFWMRFDDVNGTGDPIDLSRLQNNVSLNNGAFIGSTGQFGNEIVFDGVDDFAELPIATDIGEALHISLWLKPNTTVVPEGGTEVYMQLRNIANNFLILGSTTSNIAGETFAIGSIPGTTAVTDIELAGGVYHKLDFRWNGTAYDIYLNAVKQNTTPSSINGHATLMDVNTVCLGTRCTGGAINYNGSLDEVLIFDRPLSEDEIRSIFDAGVNQYDNIFSGLPDGIHNFTGNAVDTLGNRNETELRFVTIIRKIDSVILNSSLGTNETTENLIANPLGVVPSDVSIQYDWFKDSILSAVFLGNATSINTLPSSFTIAEEVWFVNATPKSLTNNYDVSEGIFVDTFDVSSQEINPSGMAFNNDGTKLYVIGIDSDNVNEYDLSTSFDVSTGIFVDTFDVSSQETAPTGIAFNNDGTKLYVLGTVGDDVNEYTLSTPFDVSTGTFVDSFDVSSQETLPRGMEFNNDGTKLYVIGTDSDNVNEYTLSTPFDVSTGTFVDSFDVSAQETGPQGIAFNNDGTKLYVIGSNDDDVNEYTLSTPFDVSTGTFVDSFDVSAQETLPRGIAFNNDGTKLYVIGTDGDDVNEYDVGSVITGTTVQSNNLTILDTVSPEFQGITVDPSTPATYLKEATYQFNVTWTDDTLLDIVIIEHNFTGTLTNETVSSDGNVFSHIEVDLATEVYQWRQIANDTVGNVNSTLVQTYTVNKATSIIELFLNGVASNLSIARTEQSNSTGVTITGEGTSQTLTINGNSVGTGQLISDIQTLPGGEHEYVYTHPETQNFTSDSITRTVTVSGFSGALGGIFNIILLVVALGVISQGIRLIDEEPSKEMLFIAIIGLIIAVSLFGILVAF